MLKGITSSYMALGLLVVAGISSMIFVNHFGNLSTIKSDGNPIYCPFLKSITNRSMVLYYINLTKQNNAAAKCAVEVLNTAGQQVLNRYGVDANLTQINLAVNAIRVTPSSAYVVESTIITNKSKIDAMLANMELPQNNSSIQTLTFRTARFSSYGCDTSWGGYVAYSSLSSPAAVMNATAGSWKIETASNSSPYVTLAGQWDGIGGYFSQDLIQAGTASEWTSGGGALYWAWYELYPNNPVNVSFSVSPGDLMAVEIQYSPHLFYNWNVTIIDYSKSVAQNFHVSFTVDRKSAEWIEEVPSGFDLTKFGTAYFGNYYTGIVNDWAGSNSLYSKVIGGWPNTAYEIRDSSSCSSGNLLTYPSGLQNNEGFTMTRTSNFT